MRIQILILVTLFNVSCKNSYSSDNDKITSYNSGDTEIHYKNQFELGHIKDSIASLNFDLASKQSALNNQNKAKNLYLKADKIEPNNIIILNALGNTFAELDNYASSYEYFKKSIEIDSTNSLTYLNFGVSYNKNRKHIKALEVYNKGLEFEKDIEHRGYFYYNIANVYYKMKDFKKANIYNEKALRVVKNENAREDLIELKNAISK